MHIPHGANILVTDGRKMLLFRNEGDADYANFRLVQAAEQDNPPDRLHRNDAPGHAAFLGTGRASAYDETDRHALAETRFADRTIAQLDAQIEAGEVDKLFIVADPHTLGELRHHYSDRMREALLGEIAKDLVKHPVPEIERILCSE